MEGKYATLNIEIGQAKQTAKIHFGVEGKFTRLPGEVDFNFKIDAGEEKYLLKISRPDPSLKKTLEFQQALLSHVAKQNPNLLVPEVIKNLNGQGITTFKDEQGQERLVQLLTWIDGRLWNSTNPIQTDLLESLGQTAGKLTQALGNFEHPHAQRAFEWDLAQASWINDYLHLFSGQQKEIIQYFLNRFSSFQNDYNLLPRAVVHNDVNDYNILVTNDRLHPTVMAIIDFGDAIHTQVINDLAIAIAYVVMEKPDPLSAALSVIKGYHCEYNLMEKELSFLFTLVAIRLIITVTKSAINKEKEPDNTYLLISEKPAWGVLSKWREINPEFAHLSFRLACGFDIFEQEASFKSWASSHIGSLQTLFPTINKKTICPLDLSVASTWMGNVGDFDNEDLFAFELNQLQKQNPDAFIAGGYLEPRAVYSSSAFEKEGNNGRENRTIHLGIDFWLPAGTPVHALYDGEIVIATIQADEKSYGGFIVVKHQFESAEFYTLYGHLGHESIQQITLGRQVLKGDKLGVLGDRSENGNWFPHLHFQVLLTTLGMNDDFPGVAYPSQLSIWKSLCPDPNLLFNATELKTRSDKDLEALMHFRKSHLGKSLSLSYNEPLHIVRGAGAWLLDANGQSYLDTVNNVAHVGHENKRVVKAGQDQMAVLNTNTRYLNDQIIGFAEELLQTFPDELSVVHFVNSGSEANELALRMVKAYTGQKDLIAVEIGYHGNTQACIDISSYKFDGKGGQGAPPHVHVVPLPDAYRGLYQGENTGAQYANHVQQQIDGIHQLGRKPAGFICESIVSCGGQIELPEHYLKEAYSSMRKAGGLCIADEVQVGVGRVGSHFWGFQLHDVIPDIVTIGKPIGNGHPVAAVVCTRAVADAFANGMEYFNTFGGNPVSCAIGHEVLRVVKEEGLQNHALEVGKLLKNELHNLAKDFSIIGDVRGKGLFLGFELVDNNKRPLPSQANYLANRMKELGVLMSTDGKDNNVLKIKPPMVFSKGNAEELLSKLLKVFREDYMSPFWNGKIL